MDKINLVFPTLDMKEQALAYRQAYFDHGEQSIHGAGGLSTAASYEQWVEQMEANIVGENLPDGWVPATQFFGVRASDGKIVGTIQIRHKLSAYLIEIGGHIGYGVCPTERRKGYVTQMLSKALEECRKLGLEKVLITCNADNAASEKTILRAGGVMEDSRAESDGTMVNRYWLTLL